MPRVVTHGQVMRQSETNPYAVPVDSLTFPTLAAVGPLPAADTEGVLIVTRVPNTPYTVTPAAATDATTIVYEDGNNNNTVRMRVTSVVGPAKYKITVL
jgi:hypothetical protein